MPRDSTPPAAAAAAASQPSSHMTHTHEPLLHTPKPQSTLANRIIALTLYNEGCPTNYILQRSGFKRSAFFLLLKKAKQRGFVRGEPPTEAFVTDGPRSGRPKTSKRRQRQAEGIWLAGKPDDNLTPP
ncbi:Uncharacterized protein TPAR_02985 [Tolypocladium paradoxum]|uniref:Uncharacterized protein n=1 Tax=Tolypocladium paradoxum TaxID=94208 RepID=A0A2S4L305_9HYPO|nr:Uncharacterized protein TPAR_02985 [Tolypocladium paradoxum]